VLLALALAGCASEAGLVQLLPVVRASGEEIQPVSPPSPSPPSAFGNALTSVRATDVPSDAGAAGAIFRAAAPAPPAQIETPPWLQPVKSSNSDAGDSPAGDDKKSADDNADAAPAKEKQPDVPPWFSAHFQGTIIDQRVLPFRSPYSGPLSLMPVQPGALTETATMYFDVRPWRGGEIVFNPETEGGTGLSSSAGLGGLTNGEAVRVSVLEPTIYVARLFYRQTWGLGGEWEKVEDGPNQLAGPRDIDRITFTFGKFAATDVFDKNSYSNDPRTQFENWTLMYNGAWDFPANTRGYTYGSALEINTYWWAFRYGIFEEPRWANGPILDDDLTKANGQIWEFNQFWGRDTRPGVLREWVYMNLADMGSYAEALAKSPVDPDVDATHGSRIKYGFGGNLEQQLTNNLGCFVKWGWNDGHSETWAFTAVDRTAAAGFLLKGGRWDRPNDTVGLAGAINGLSQIHREYLAAGGLDFSIGDGKLNYEPEELLEAFYNVQIAKGINFTSDIQAINNPAYNADRGPVFVWGIRIHLEH
jgi:high affinity Mn2+ porin